MKRVVLSLMVVLGLLALPAIAQEEGSTTATGETLQEERTNPSSDSIAPDSGLTLSGTVVSWNDQQLVLKTVTGVEHLQLQSNTVRPSTLTAGEAVTVDYTRTSQGVMIAKQIRLGGTMDSTTTSTTTTLTEPATGTGVAGTKIGDGIDQETELEQDVEEAVADVGEAADEVGAELSEVDDAVEEEVEEAANTSIDDDDSIGNADALPATGGKAPLAALLGLLAIGAAVALRRL
jgi:hypothetical protein